MVSDHPALIVCAAQFYFRSEANTKLLAAFRADTRTDKLDLGVGVYKDINGGTPVMQAVKSAETKLLREQDTKAYVGPLGSAHFNQGMITTVFGADAYGSPTQPGLTMFRY